MPSSKKKVKQPEKADQDTKMETGDSSGDDENEDIKLVTNNQDDVMQVDFEAFPLEEADRGGVAKLLGQLFLRAKIDLNDVSKLLIKQQPLGCVFRPAEEFAMDDCEDDVYGVLSVVALHDAEVC
uniref:Uncharacterized protein n=1 Tax=Plectus sambesii TaxID=2011161 RepID=A0A914V8C1_9BILA